MEKFNINTSNCKTKSINFTTTTTIRSKSCLCTDCMHQQFHLGNWFRNYLDLIICELIPLHVLDQPVCSMLVYYSQAWLTVPVYIVHFFCDLLCPEFQSHSDDTHTHVTAPCSAHVLAQKCGHVNDLFSYSLANVRNVQEPNIPSHLVCVKYYL